VNQGSIMFRAIRIQEKPIFIEYLKSGWTINTAIAIDYTASNMDPDDPASLHYISG
jgi:hypothetical protein